MGIPRCNAVDGHADDAYQQLGALGCFVADFLAVADRARTMPAEELRGEVIRFARRAALVLDDPPLYRPRA